MTKTKWPNWVAAQQPDLETGNLVECSRYFNVGEVGIAIVAVVSMWNQDHKWVPFDWTAYIGGSVRGAEREAWAIEDAVRSGNKLARADAAYFFPDLPSAFWRA